MPRSPANICKCLRRSRPRVECWRYREETPVRAGVGSASVRSSLGERHRRAHRLHDTYGFVGCFFPDKDLNMKPHCPYMRKENTVDIAPTHTLSRYVTIQEWLLFSVINVIHVYCRKFEKYRKGERRITHQRELPHFRGNYWQHFGLFPSGPYSTNTATLCQARCWAPGQRRTPYSLTTHSLETERPSLSVVTVGGGVGADLRAPAETLDLAKGFQWKR